MSVEDPHEPGLDVIDEGSPLLTAPPKNIQDMLRIPGQHKAQGVYLKYYWKLLFIVGAFYALPSFQFVLLQYYERQDTYQNGDLIPLNSTSAGVYCYYNMKCAHPFLGLEAFNNIISNLGYLCFGTFFLLYVYFTSRSDDDSTDLALGTGLHNDYSLYYCLGWSLCIEGVFSALYHVCPSKIDFQFDSSFMIVGSGLLFMTIYQKRHPTLTSGAFRVYGYFAFLIGLNTLSLFRISTLTFWLIVCILLAIVSLRFAMILFANIVNWTFTIATAVHGFSTATTTDFPTFILNVLHIHRAFLAALMVLNTWIYLLYYTIMKYRSGEKVLIKVWILAALMVAALVSAIHFYNIAVTDKSLTPAESAALNKPCVVFDYFDYHDIWHFLSAAGVLLTYLVVYMLDDDIKDTPRDKIKVF